MDERSVFSPCVISNLPRIQITATLLRLIPSDPPASISPNQISLVGLFIIAGSDCEWCLANGFSIQICRLDAPESQQGLSFLWRRWLRSGVNKKGMTLLKYAFVVVFFSLFLSWIWIDFFFFKVATMKKGRGLGLASRSNSFLLVCPPKVTR